MSESIIEPDPSNSNTNLDIACDPSWLSDIRCPQYFDFTTATTFPCTQSSSYNPPLRDELYASDEETREFFETLETDPQHHAFCNESNKESVQIDVELVKKAGPPRYHNLPSSTFEEYLAQCNTQQEPANTSTPPPSQTSRPPSVRTPAGTPTARRPRRQLTFNDKDESIEQAMSQLSLNESMPTPTRNPGRTSRPAGQPLRNTSSSNATLSPRGSRSTTASRSGSASSDHPSGSSITSFLSKSSGARRIAKSRSYIDQETKPENAGNRFKPMRKTGPQTVEQLNASSAKLNNGNDLRNSKHSSHNSNTSDEIRIEQDDELIKMMEEHNRKLNGTSEERTRSNSQEGSDNNEPSSLDSSLPASRQSSKDTELSSDGNQEDANLSSISTAGTQGNPTNTAGRQEAPLQPGSVRQTKSNRISVRNGQFVPRRVQNLATSNSSQTGTQQVSDSQQTKDISSSTNQGPSKSLEEMLQSENSRVLQDRQNRLMERQKANRADRDSVLRKFRTDKPPATQRQNRTTARVAFTASEPTRPKTLASNRRRVVSNTTELNRGDESSRSTLRQRTDISSRRGITGVNSEANAVSRVLPQSSTNGSSRPREPQQGPQDKKPTTWTDRLKAVDQRKRMEARMDNDLKSILSQHNSRVHQKRQTEKTAQ